jgi:serralysin
LSDIPGSTSTTATVTVGSTTSSAIDTNGDHDWYAVTLAAGESITVTLTGGGNLDTYLNVYDPTGTTILASNDDIVAGQNQNSRLTFYAQTAGTYYIDVGAWHDQSTGTYDLFVEPNLRTWSNDQIAYQLTNGYWGGDVHHFNVTQGGTITVNVSTLSAADQTLARAALSEWSDIIGVHFQEVTSSAQISFSDALDPSGPIAQTSAIWSNGITTSANIQISKSWTTDYGSTLDSYGFQTYVHEIGHALGLGHSGEYNVDATYPTDALFLNDAWSTSVMSYFSPTENYYFSNQGFSYDYSVTPMVADILAMQQLYGLSTTTRTGDTTYGYHSNAGGIYNASLYPDVAYTIYDSGGTDTLDFSGSQYNQLLNLNPETFSNVNGSIGNLSIARGVTIENAIGGSGDDTIIGNAANNVLNGGAGTDTLSYETADAGVTVSLGLTTAQNTVGAGTDTVSGFERLIGSAHADVLTAGATTIYMDGGSGDDVLNSVAANDVTMLGGDGNDTFIVGTGAFVANGGAGFNTIDGSTSTAGLVLSTSSATNIQEFIGSNYADHLTSTGTGVQLSGGGGDDTLTSIVGGDLLVGGTGNDTYVISPSSTDQIVENPGGGIDTVVPRSNYTLGANLENLTLYENLPWDPYAGASVGGGPPPENWTATGNDVANVIIGNLGDDVLTGLGGADTLTGGGGADTFRDTKAGLSGDTITDFGAGDKIVFTDASLAGFTFSISGHTLTYTGGSLTLSSVPAGHLMVTAAAGGGVQLELPSFLNDFSGDGISDILWQNDSGQLTLWLGNSSGGFATNGVIRDLMLPTGSTIVGTGDFNDDGHADILLRDSSGTITDWLGNSTGGFTANGANATSLVPTSWHVVGTGDFNGDGHADILWRNDSGALTDWLGTDNGGFTSNWANAGTSIPTDWTVIGTGDFNGDGNADVLWRNSAGVVTDQLGNASGGFAANWANLSTGVPSSWTVVGTGDFNGDGITDVLWRNSNGTMVDWIGNANGGFTANWANAPAGVGPEWHVAEIGDFNGDGHADILWRNDNGAITDWLGTSNGGFTDNSMLAATTIDTNWHVQPVSDHLM